MNLNDLTLGSWVTSDHHWAHDNIKRFQNRPDDHFERMFDLWCERVKPDDVLLHLGDLVCYSHRYPDISPEWWIEGLPGKKMIILGNHDKLKPQFYEHAGFTILGRGDKPFFWHRPDNGKVIAFSHEPIVDDGGWSINVHGHIHANKHHPEAGSLEKRINVCVEVTRYAPILLRDALAELG